MIADPLEVPGRLLQPHDQVDLLFLVTREILLNKRQACSNASKKKSKNDVSSPTFSNKVTDERPGVLERGFEERQGPRLLQVGDHRHKDGQSHGPLRVLNIHVFGWPVGHLLHLGHEGW